jgi:hypothetical protein
LYFPRGEIVMADAAKCAAPTELILFEFRGAPLPGAKKDAFFLYFYWLQLRLWATNLH